jgi:pSer/pThr/pTyr-binding forkhead associated (FHA) protein
MPITVIVRTVGDDGVRLTFDGTQRVVIGRGAGSDVRLPDSSVSHRHATIRAQGAEFVLVDEGSTNGTFVGGIRIAAHTSRLVRSHDQVRLGRMWLELRLEQNPVTRDVAAATRDLALALVSQAIAAVGGDTTTRVRVMEGADQGAVILLAEGDRDYVLGRGPHCDLLLSDADVSREHLRVVRRNGTVFVCDLGTRNGTQIGEARAPRGEPVLWRPALMIKMGQTVLALEEPVVQALALIENSADEPFALAAAPAGLAPVSEAAAVIDGEFGPEGGTPRQDVADRPLSAPNSAAMQRPRRTGWSVTDLVVMTAAVGVLVLSLAGLVWLMRG